MCFFCSKPEAAKKKLHEIWTFQLDYLLRKCADEVQDDVLAQLSEGDPIAHEHQFV